MNHETFDRLIADHQLGMSEMQLDRFVTSRADYGGGGTTYGRYKQALRELWKRWRGLKGLLGERALMELDVEVLDMMTRRWFCRSVTRRRARIELEQKRLQLQEVDKTIEDTEREFVRFYQQAEALKQVVGDLTPARRDQLDREMWAHNLKAAAALEVITTGRVGHNTVMFIQAGPCEWRKPLLLEIFGGGDNQEERARYRADLVKWFLEHEPEVALPALVVPTLCHADVRKLLEEEPR